MGSNALADLAALKYDLALANRMVAHEGVLDAFGHISIRHPEKPDRYFLSCSRSPELVTPADIYEFDLESQPVSVPADVKLYGERVIHGCIYQARPDVQAVVHHHSGSMLPFCFTDRKLVAVYHLGASMGAEVPVWDMRDDFGETNLIVKTPEEGRSLATALGPNWIVLMRRHGVTVAGRTLPEVVFRSIWAARNAEYLLRGSEIGNVTPLSRSEIEQAEAYNLAPGPLGRSFEYWTRRLEKAGELPPKGKPRAKARSVKKPATRAGVKTLARTKRKSSRR